MNAGRVMGCSACGAPRTSVVGPCTSCGAGSAATCSYCGKDADTRVSLELGSVCGACGKPRVEHERQNVQTKEEIALLEKARFAFARAARLKVVGFVAGLVAGASFFTFAWSMTTFTAGPTAASWIMMAALLALVAIPFAFVYARRAFLRRADHAAGDGRAAVARAQQLANDPARVRVELTEEVAQGDPETLEEEEASEPSLRMRKRP